MQYLHQIVCTMNDTIKAGLSDSRFNDSKYYAIAVPAANGDKVMPMILDVYDENIYITPDDSVPLTAYHRTIGISRSDMAVNSYGSDGNTGKKEVATMAMIVMAARKMLKMTPEELEAAIIANMPSQIAKTTTSVLKLSSCQVIPTTSELDPVKVYLEETKNRVYDLPPNMLMVRINYTITSTYKVPCFDITQCDCLN